MLSSIVDVPIYIPTNRTANQQETKISEQSKPNKNKNVDTGSREVVTREEEEAGCG